MGGREEPAGGGLVVLGALEVFQEVGLRGMWLLADALCWFGCGSKMQALLRSFSAASCAHFQTVFSAAAAASLKPTQVRHTACFSLVFYPDSTSSSSSSSAVPSPETAEMSDPCYRSDVYVASVLIQYGSD